MKTVDIPIELLRAGEDFRHSLVPRADNKKELLWHGWAIMDAFVAGAAWQKEQKEQQDENR